jgi:hypothetical protein
MTDRIALAGEIAARTTPRFVEIKPERGKRNRSFSRKGLKALREEVIAARKRGSSARSQREKQMPTIYISDKGDDKNNGLSPQTAVYSLKRALKLQGGKNDHSMHFGPRAWQRIKKQLAETKKEK